MFEDVLLDAKQEEWAERLAFMQKIPELSGLSEIELKSLNESASLESFEYENVSHRETHIFLSVSHGETDIILCVREGPVLYFWSMRPNRFNSKFFDPFEVIDRRRLLFLLSRL